MNITASDIFTIAWTFIAALALFSLSVFIHELGHFIAARKFGLVVQRFAIGMGPKIWGCKKNGVEYAINWLPLGGFVQLPQLVAMEMIEGDLEFDPKTLPPVSPWARLATAFFGPLFSFALAVALAFVVYWAGVPDKKISSMVIGYVEPESPAAQAGIQPGDKIISVDHIKVKYWDGKPNSVVNLILLHPEKSIHLEIQRHEEILNFDLTPQKNPELENLRTLGFEQHPLDDLIVDATTKGFSAEAAKLQHGDKIVSVNGVKVFSKEQVSQIVRKTEGPFPIEYLRDSQTYTAWVESKKTNELTYPIIGVKWKLPNPVIVHPTPYDQISDSATVVARTLRALTSPSSGIGLRHMSGPIGIFDKIMYILTIDFRLLLAFMVMLNVNLAVLNLLPIPVLDGGHITLCLLEMIRKKPLDTKIVQGLFTTCFVLLIAMILYTGFYDVLRIGKRITKEQEAAQAAAKAKTETVTPAQP